MPRNRIREGERIPVRFTVRERALLLDHTAADPEYAERLQPVPGREDLAGEFTLDDLEDLLGYIAAEANHTEDAKLRKALDGLYHRLLKVQRSYDDGNWADSGD